MCGKLHNEDKDNIDQDSEVCAIGVQNIMQSDQSMPHNQNKLKIPLTQMLFYRPTSWCEKSKVCMVSKIKFCWYLEKSSFSSNFWSSFPRKVSTKGGEIANSKKTTQKSARLSTWGPSGAGKNQAETPHKGLVGWN